MLVVVLVVVFVVVCLWPCLCVCGCACGCVLVEVLRGTLPARTRGCSDDAEDEDGEDQQDGS